MSGLPTLSKTLDPADYAQLVDEVARVRHGKAIFANLYDYGHDHRTWEYAIALASFGSRDGVRGKKVIDVGGGPSLLGGILAWGGAVVTVNDLIDYSTQQDDIGRRALACTAAVPGGSFLFVQADFAQESVGLYDAVICTSVIEHVESDDAFFQQLLSAVRLGGVLVLTTDFHPSGQARCEGHLRTYNRESLEAWAATPGFAVEGGVDYADRGGPVYGYNFASLVLRRIA